MDPKSSWRFLYFSIHDLVVKESRAICEADGYHQIDEYCPNRSLLKKSEILASTFAHSLFCRKILKLC